MDTVRKQFKTAIVLTCSVVVSSAALAAGEVREVGTSTVPATPYRYTAEGLTHTWGVADNQLIESFSTDNDTFRFASVANRVELVRDDISDVSTGVPCGVFAERAGPSASLLAADFPNDADGSGNCDMAAMLASRVVNRGALDVFSNVGPTPKNVERVDYLFDYGVFAAFSNDGLEHMGHLVAEKRGNNPIQIAAVLSLDAFGQPATFGPLVRVHDFAESDESKIRYGETNLRHNYSFFQSNSLTPQAFPVYLRDSTEQVAMAFVSAERLGLAAGQQYFGFSYFGDDVDSAVHVLTDPSTFPNNTADNYIVYGDGADIYGGVSGMFVSDSISVGTGAVFLDENNDGINDTNEAGITDITLNLFEDTNSDGILDPNLDVDLGELTSGMDGEFVLPGLPNGNFLLLLDSDDSDLPAGTQVPADANPLAFTVNNNDPDNLNFAVTDQPMNDGGTDSGGTDDGATDSGGTDGGAADSGGTDAGGTDAGGTDGGGTDAGGTDAGGTDSGGTDAGGTDAGGTDAGSTDAGGTDAGSTDSGGSDAGGTDSGGTDSGGSDAGGTDSGGSDAGGTDAGGPEAPNDGGEGAVPGVTTDAIPDTAQLEQGNSIEIFVLDNDVDASGQGLSLVSFDESPNAAISITDGPDGVDTVIVYQPNALFYGTDTFFYTMIDGNGVEASATVTVEVLRASDINGNGINDFIECQCTSLQLETGVHGSGVGGSMNWLVLFLLGLAGALRIVVRMSRQRTFWSA